MEPTEKLCLQWNDFKENTISSFRELRSNKDLADVTLACEDGKQFEAHRLVLASSSPFFMSLFKTMKSSNPLIYMRGSTSEDLVAILDFLYLGEANVFQSNLDSFLALAEGLKLKGLTGGVGRTKEEEEIHIPPSETSGSQNQSKMIKQNHKTFGSGFEHQNETLLDYDTAAVAKNTGIDVDQQNFDEHIQSMITKSDVSSGKGKKLKLATCNICGKEAAFQNMPRHIEAKHITGVSHACGICGKTSKSKHGLLQHKLMNHHR